MSPSSSTRHRSVTGLCRAPVRGPAFSLCAVNELPQSLIRDWLAVQVMAALHGSQCEPVQFGRVSLGLVPPLGVSDSSAHMTNQQEVGA